MAVPLRSPRFTEGPTSARFQQALNNTPTIKSGEPNRQAVRLLQQALIDFGIQLPDSTKKYGSPDGRFGKETREAVKKFQKQQFPGETPDGKVGHNTLSRLDDLLPRAGAPLPPLDDALDDVDIEEMGKKAVLNVLRGPFVTNVHFVYRGQEINFGWFHLVDQYLEIGRINILYDPIVGDTGLAVYCPENSHAIAPNCIVIPKVNIVTWKQRSVFLHECVHAIQDIRGIALSSAISEGAAHIAQNLYHRLATGNRVTDSNSTADAIHAAADVFAQRVLSENTHSPTFSAAEMASLDQAIANAGYGAGLVAYDGVPE